MAPSPHWILALVELIYYAPCALPLTYILWKHRRAGVSGWLFFTLFIGLQCAGSGMTVGSGQNGTPSSTAIIIVQVGLSPLILGVSGLVHEYARLSGLVTKGRGKKRASIANVVFHIGVITSIAIYAVGAADSFKSPPLENAQTLYKAGILLLLFLFIALLATFTTIAAKAHGTQTVKPLFWSIAISLLLLTIRLVYSTVSAFNIGDPQFGPVSGRIVYQILLVFLPGALIVAAIVTGGVMTTHVDVQTDPATDRERAIAFQNKRPSDSSV